MRFLILLPLFVSAPLLCHGKLHANQISNLPGAEVLIFSFRQFSGYFEVSKTHKLHFWFVESKSNPKKDPVIFWFTGGPGCSSLYGLLQEMGPIILEPDAKTLRSNDFAWNQNASIIYLESPFGVGFSRLTNDEADTVHEVRLKQVTLENYEAVKDFYKKFPEYRENPMFLMGEGYAAFYIAALSDHILAGNPSFKINLQGLAIGNGLLDEELNEVTRLEYAYGHGFYDENQWTSFENNCCSDCFEQCELNPKKPNEKCDELSRYAEDALLIEGLNPYDIYRQCNTSVDKNQPPKASDKIFFDAGLCANHSAITAYLNQKTVRTALQIPENLPEWKICNDKVSIVYEEENKSVKNYLSKTISKGVRVLLYYGDADMVCNFIMGQRFAANLGLKLVSPKHQMFLHKELIGFYTNYENLTVVTVLNAGHSPTKNHPPEMLHIIRTFMSNSDFWAIRDSYEMTV